MEKVSLLFIFTITQLMCSQQLVNHGEFPPRDFYINNDTITYIEKRHVIIKSGTYKKSYFIGGYGLEIYDNKENNEIISVSNELRQTVSSVRFFNKSSQKVEEVFYYKTGRSLDAAFLKNQELIALSLTDKKIILLDHSKKPQFSIYDELTLSSMCRKLLYTGDCIYFGTDSGQVFKYHISSKSTEELFKTNAAITDLQLVDNYLIYATIDGKVVRRNLLDKSELIVDLKENFALNSYLDSNDKVFLGTFTGEILVLNPNSMKIEKKVNHHKRTVLKITQYNGEFYSSSIDKTLKKWTTP